MKSCRPTRGIERLCREHVSFIALCGDTSPHFTTLAAFVSCLGEEVAALFAQVLFLCDQQGLIGRQMFAIDGVKLPSNASKAKSGTRADFDKQADKLEVAARKMIERHRANDSEAEAMTEATLEVKAAERLAKLRKQAAELRAWLKDHPEDRKGTGKRGSVRLSNRTDGESAKMATSKGVIQGYCGVAAVDAAHQIIIDAQAHGTGSEQELLLGVVTATRPQATPDTLYTADAGYHSETNLQALAQQHIQALIADNGMRSRDERFKDQARHKAKPDPLYDKAHPKKPAKRYRPADFQYDARAGTCICPAGKALYQNGANCTINGRRFTKFSGSQRDQAGCRTASHRYAPLWSGLAGIGPRRRGCRCGAHALGMGCASWVRRVAAVCRWLAAKSMFGLSVVVVRTPCVRAHRGGRRAGRRSLKYSPLEQPACHGRSCEGDVASQFKVPPSLGDLSGGLRIPRVHMPIGYT